MMYFSRLKTMLILGACLLGAIFCIPNLVPAPAAWLPWRTVHLGLDLRGGTYLLLQVDMDAVIKERLNGLLDGVRQALRPGQIFYPTLEAQPEQNRILLRLRDATRTDAAVAALKPLVSTEGPGGTPDLDITSQPDGTVTLTLSPVALNARAQGAVQQSIEIVRRRIDETGVVDPQITQQGNNRIVVQLPGIGDPDRIKQLLGKTAHMTFQLVDEAANPTAGGPPPPGDDFLPMQDDPDEKIAVRKRVDVDGGDLTDARAGDESADRRMGGELHLQLHRRPAVRRHHPRQRRPPVRHRAGRQGDQRPGHPRADHRRTRPDQRQLHRRLAPPTLRCCCAPARCRRR